MEEKINKINLDTIIRDISEKTDYNYSEVKNILDIIISKFREYLRDNDKIEIRGLGTFYTREHKGRYVHHKTKIIDSKNHYVTLFKESSTLQKSVNTQ